MRYEYDLCIIGGGAAGLVVAAGAATLGAKVVLVEKNALGGDCLHYGCVPSKTLIHSAKVAYMLRDAPRFGIPAQVPFIELATVMQRVQQIIRQIEPNDSPERFTELGVELIFGAGQFSSTDMFAVDGKQLRARHFVIATGSRPSIPPIPGLDQTPFLTNETLFGLQEDIRHALILGGGPIGCEMAQALGRLGSRVSLFSADAGLLPREDAEISDVIAAQFRQDAIDLHLGVQVLKLENDSEEGEIRALLEHPQQGQYWLSGSHLLIAAGRQANIDQLGLETAGVEVRQGRLVLDARLRTTNRRIYACGDVAGPYLFTHMAEHQAGVVLRNTLFHWPSKVRMQGIPWCTFTDPEVARVGYSENEAVRQGIAHRVYHFPFAQIDRAITAGQTAGMAKIITSPRGKLLGACIVGAHAGELIAEFSLAISKGLSTADISNTLHIYPTLAQINRRVADLRLKEALTPTRRKWLQRIFGFGR